MGPALSKSSFLVKLCSSEVVKEHLCVLQEHRLAILELFQQGGEGDQPIKQAGIHDEAVLDLAEGGTRPSLPLVLQLRSFLVLTV